MEVKKYGSSKYSFFRISFQLNSEMQHTSINEHSILNRFILKCNKIKEEVFK